MKYLFLIVINLFLYVSCTTSKSSSVDMTNPISEPKIGETVTLPSGLKYKIIQYGLGNSPRANSKVKAHYHGTLQNGTVFDSSYDRGQPFIFNLNQVIKGWQEGLQLMKEGAIWELTVPPHLGYGSEPSGKIPANSTLTFKVELLKVL